MISIIEDLETYDAVIESQGPFHSIEARSQSFEMAKRDAKIRISFTPSDGVHLQLYLLQRHRRVAHRVP